MNPKQYLYRKTTLTGIITKKTRVLLVLLNVRFFVKEKIAQIPRRPPPYPPKKYKKKTDKSKDKSEGKLASTKTLTNLKNAYLLLVSIPPRKTNLKNAYLLLERLP